MSRARASPKLLGLIAAHGVFVLVPSGSPPMAAAINQYPLPDGMAALQPANTRLHGLPAGYAAYHTAYAAAIQSTAAVVGSARS
jgi:hypothetical protein